MRPRLLDLFCGAGGAAMGYHRAGFEVYGVDIAAPPKPIGTVEHAYSHGALDLTRKVLDLAQAWIDKEGLGT